MNNEKRETDERLCPFCGIENQCGVASGDCWCFHIKVPLELRDQIPAELRGKACICRKCVEEFNAEQLSS